MKAAPTRRYRRNGSGIVTSAAPECRSVQKHIRASSFDPGNLREVELEIFAYATCFPNRCTSRRYPGLLIASVYMWPVETQYQFTCGRSRLT